MRSVSALCWRVCLPVLTTASGVASRDVAVWSGVVRSCRRRQSCSGVCQRVFQCGTPRLTWDWSNTTYRQSCTCARAVSSCIDA